MTSSLQPSPLHQQIFYLTTVLKGHKSGDPVLPPLDRNLRLLDRIATLFTTGTPKGTRKDIADQNADRVVAVTGLQTEHGFQSIIATRDTRFSGTTSEFQVVPLEPDEKRAAEALANWDHPCVFCLLYYVFADYWDSHDYDNFKSHVLDVVALIQASFAGRIQSRPDIANFHKFVVGRCFPKMRVRMHLGGTRLWTTHPIKIIAAFWQDRLADTSCDFTATITITASSDATLLHRLTTPTNISSKYLVGRNHLAAWLKLLPALHDRIRNSLEAMRRAADQPKDLVTMFGLYDTIVRSGLLEALLEQGGDKLTKLLAGSRYIIDSTQKPGLSLEQSVILSVLTALVLLKALATMVQAARALVTPPQVRWLKNMRRRIKMPQN